MSELKPCPFCSCTEKYDRVYSFGTDIPGGDGNIALCLRHTSGSYTLHAESIGHNEDGTDYCDNDDDAPINFCPICGKQLNRRAQPANSRFADCHIWEPGDKLETISDKCEVLIKAADIKALMAQPTNEPCSGCSGIMYRQTNSGKIIPANKKCAVIEPPPCYHPDGDGCAYQIYGDNNDEPIDRCKVCPLCNSDKVRHKQPANDPLTCDGCENQRRNTGRSAFSYEDCIRCRRHWPDRYKPEGSENMAGQEFNL